jgi:hypothetical protein
MNDLEPKDSGGGGVQRGTFLGREDTGTLPPCPPRHLRAAAEGMAPLGSVAGSRLLLLSCCANHDSCAHQARCVGSVLLLETLQEGL